MNYINIPLEHQLNVPVSYFYELKMAKQKIIQKQLHLFSLSHQRLRCPDKFRTPAYITTTTEHCTTKYLYNNVIKTMTNEKSAERRKHCTLAVVRRSQKFSPSRRPLPRGAGWPKFNQLEMVSTFTYRPSLLKINARNFELLW